MNVPSGFASACLSGKFVITAEIGPPKGTDLSNVRAGADLLKNRVDGLNVTDNQSAVMRLAPLAAAHEINRLGGEAICQFTCRDRNRLALQSDLLAAHVLGIRNILCLTGDHPAVGDHPEAKPVYDFDSVHLLQCARGLNQGRDWNGAELSGATDFFLGAVVTPGADPLPPQLMKFGKKIEAGAEFFQTQAVYDIDCFARFMEEARRIAGGAEVKILAGLLVLTGIGMARYVNASVPGITIPDDLLQEMAAAPKGEAALKGAEICARHIRFLREEGICDGVHIMAVGRPDLVPRVLDLAEVGSGVPPVAERG